MGGITLYIRMTRLILCIKYFYTITREANMTKLYIFPDDLYEKKPEDGDAIAGRLYYSISEAVEQENLNDGSDGDEYTFIVIDTDNFEKITIHNTFSVDEKPLYPAKKDKKDKKGAKK